MSIHVELLHVLAQQPVIIGEWSLGLDESSLQGVPRGEAEKQLGVVQLQSYSAAAGCFFWNYKTEQADGWNYRHLVEVDILPDLTNEAERLSIP